MAMAMDTATGARRLLCVAATLCSALAYAQTAQPSITSITPGVIVGEQYSSNAFPQEANDRKTAWITSVGALLGINHRGQGLDFSSDMRWTKQLYSSASERNHADRALNASARIELIDDILDVGSRASIARRGRGAFTATLPAAGDNATTADQVETRQASIRPAWHSRLGSALVLQAWSETTNSKTDEPSGRNSRSTDSVASVSSNRTASGMVDWSISAQSQQFAGSDFDRSVRRGQASLMINPGDSIGFSLFGGREQSDLQNGLESSSTIWGGGLRWIPHERLAIAATAGKRFFGTEYALAVAYRRPLSALRLAVVRDIGFLGDRTTIGSASPFVGMLSELLRSTTPDPTIRDNAARGRLREAGVPIVLGAPLDSAVAVPFLNQRIDLAYLYSGIRETFTVTIGYRKQEAFAGNASTIAGVFEDSRQKNAGVIWAHRLSNTLTLNYNFQFVQTEDLKTALRQTTQRQHSLNTTTRLGPRTTLSLSARHLDLQSSVIRGYIENIVGCNLEMRF